MSSHTYSLIQGRTTRISQSFAQGDYNVPKIFILLYNYQQRFYFIFYSWSPDGEIFKYFLPEKIVPHNKKMYQFP